MPADPDPHCLARFVDAQQGVFETALDELQAGRKLTHWMWFVFPQIAGLGTSDTSRRFAIRGAQEARAYLAHPVLGPRLQRCAAAVLQHAGRPAASTLGMVDAMKLRSCATLFAFVSPAGSVFAQLLDAFFGGVGDSATRSRLGGADAAGHGAAPRE